VALLYIVSAQQGDALT